MEVSDAVKVYPIKIYSHEIQARSAKRKDYPIKFHSLPIDDSGVIDFPYGKFHGTYIIMIKFYQTAFNRIDLSWSHLG